MKKIIFTLLILVFITVILSWLLYKQQQPVDGILKITDAKGKEYVIEEFPLNRSQQLDIGKGKKLAAVPLKVFLKTMLSDDTWSNISFLSRDNARLIVDRNELENIYLAYITADEEPYVRLVIPSDDFHQRWLKYISQIQLQ
jgi:hypothetical protein